MYQVYLSKNSYREYELFHSPASEDIEKKVVNCKLTLAAEDIDALTFDVYPTHELFDYFSSESVYSTWLMVKDENRNYGGSKDNSFEGRVISVSKAMDSEGNLYKHIVAEGCAAILMDTTIDNTKWLVPGGQMTIGDDNLGQIVPMEDGTMRVKPKWYFRKILEEFKGKTGHPIEIGTYMLHFYDEPLTAGSLRNDYYYAQPTYGTTAYDMLQDLISSEVNDINRHATYGQVLAGQERVALYVYRTTSGMFSVNILDYSLPSENTIEIELTKNMESVDYTADYTDVVHTITPLGYETTQDVEYTLDEDKSTAGDEVVGGTFIYKKATRKTLSDFINYDGAADASIPALLTEITSSGNSYNLQTGTITKDFVKGKYGGASRVLVLDNIYSEREVEGEDGEIKTERYISYSDAFRFLRQCAAYLRNHSKPNVSISVAAYDLTYIKGGTFFTLYSWCSVTNRLIDLKSAYPIVKLCIDIDSPYKSTIELGSTTPRDSSYTIRRQKIDQKQAAKTIVPKDDTSGIGPDNYALAGVGSDSTYKESSGGVSGQGYLTVTPFKTQYLHPVSNYWASTNPGAYIRARSVLDFSMVAAYNDVASTVSKALYVPQADFHADITKEIYEKYKHTGAYMFRKYYPNISVGSPVAYLENQWIHPCESVIVSGFNIHPWSHESQAMGGQLSCENMQWEFVPGPATVIETGSDSYGDYQIQVARAFVKIKATVVNRSSHNTSSAPFNVSAFGFVAKNEHTGNYFTDGIYPKTVNSECYRETLTYYDAGWLDNPPDGEYESHSHTYKIEVYSKFLPA